MEDLLVRLVEAPTLLGDEAPGQAIMREAFADLGLDPVDVPLDPEALHGHPGASPFSWEVEGKASVVAAWEPAGPAGGRSLVLNGHIDVVSPEPTVMWASPPFAARRDGDWLYGRGAGDMKAGLAAIVGAVRGLRALGLTPGARVELQSVVEEECSGNGALGCVLAGHTADAAIVTEPTSGAIQHSQVGVLWFGVQGGRPPRPRRRRAQGPERHRGHLPDRARAARARGRAERRPSVPVRRLPPPHQPQRGDDPGRRLALHRGRREPDPLPAGALPGRRRRRAQAAGGGGRWPRPRRIPCSRGSWWRCATTASACRGYTLDAEAPLVGALAGAAERATGERPALFGSTATTDARAFQLYGDCPAVCLGPHAEGVHGVDERVFLPSMVETAQVLGLFIGDWCGLSAN